MNAGEHANYFDSGNFALVRGQSSLDQQGAAVIE
jgi:hypothetical protein